jgi:hypothetical protein
VVGREGWWGERGGGEGWEMREYYAGAV